MHDRIDAARGRGAIRRSLLALLLVALPACDTEELLEVEEPTFATPGTLNSLEGLAVLYAGAIGDFQAAYSGRGGAVDDFLSVSTLFSDEYRVADTFTTRNATDQRAQFPTDQGNTSDGAYFRLHYARRAAADVAAAIAEVAPQKTADPRYAIARSLEGFSIIALAEAFCGAIPISEGSGGVPGQPGVPLTTQQLFQEAATRFDDALAGNAASDLARVGKARALLNNGDFAGAASAVAAVPTNFVHMVEHSANSTRQQNPLYALMQNRRYTVADVEGVNGLNYRASQDPRVPWIQNSQGGFDSAVPMYVDLRHPSFGADVPLASGVEARLIEAEAALRANNTALWLQKLNDLRANAATLMPILVEGWANAVPGPNNPTRALAALTDPGTAAARVDLMFRERAFWLYSTGHRHGDMRRLVRQYQRTEGQVFPTGAHHRGGVYGTDVNFPIPFRETQNPNYTVDMCKVGEA